MTMKTIGMTKRLQEYLFCRSLHDFKKQNKMFVILKKRIPLTVSGLLFQVLLSLQAVAGRLATVDKVLRYGPYLGGLCGIINFRNTDLRQFSKSAGRLRRFPVSVSLARDLHMRLSLSPADTARKQPILHCRREKSFKN